MTDRIEKHGAELDEQITSAGGSDAVIASLGKGLEDLRVINRRQAIGLISLAIISVILGAVSIYAYTNSIRIDQNNRRIAQVVELSDANRYRSCLSGLEVLKQFDQFIQAQLDIENTTSYSTKADMSRGKRRAEAYKDALVIPLPSCAYLKPPEKR